MKKVNIKKVFFCLLFIVLIIYGLLEFNNYFMSRNFVKGSGNGNASVSANTVNNSYGIVKEDINDNYAGKRTNESV